MLDYDMIYNDNDDMTKLSEDELNQVVLYILNTFCNKQKYRKEILDVNYRLRSSELMYIDDEDEVDEPDYYYSGSFIKSSPQLTDKRDSVKFSIEFWLSEYNTFAKLKKFIMNYYDNPDLIRHSKAPTPYNPDRDINDDAPKGYSPDNHIIDIGLDLDLEGDDFDPAEIVGDDDIDEAYDNGDLSGMEKEMDAIDALYSYIPDEDAYTALILKNGGTEDDSDPELGYFAGMTPEGVRGLLADTIELFRKTVEAMDPVELNSRLKTDAFLDALDIADIKIDQRGRIF